MLTSPRAVAGGNRGLRTQGAGPARWRREAGDCLCRQGGGGGRRGFVSPRNAGNPSLSLSLAIRAEVVSIRSLQHPPLASEAFHFKAPKDNFCDSSQLLHILVVSPPGCLRKCRAQFLSRLPPFLTPQLQIKKLSTSRRKKKSTICARIRQSRFSSHKTAPR